MKIKKHINFIIATIILSTCVVFVYKNIFATSEKTSTSNNEFPSRMANWAADEVIYDKNVLSILDPDKIVYRNYHNNTGHPPITLFIGYYNTLEKADFSHSPLVCFTGQGWKIDSTTKKEISIDLQDTPIIRVNQMIQTKLNTTMITLFWYQSTHRAFTNRGIQKLSLFLGKFSGRLDHNAFIRITTIVPPEKSEEETITHLFSFIKDMYPELKRFLL